MNKVNAPHEHRRVGGEWTAAKRAEKVNHALRVAVAFKREVERGLSGLIHRSDEKGALLDAADVTHEVHRGLREEERERERVR